MSYFCVAYWITNTLKATQICVISYSEVWVKKKFSFLCFNVMTYATNPIPGAPKGLKSQKENWPPWLGWSNLPIKMLPLRKWFKWSKTSVIPSLLSFLKLAINPHIGEGVWTTLSEALKIVPLLGLGKDGRTSHCTGRSWEADDAWWKARGRENRLEYPTAYLIKILDPLNWYFCILSW